MMFATVNGITLAYRVTGSATGRPLVFANSLGSDARIWDDVVALLAPRYRVLCYDKRGHGLSDGPDGPASLDDHVADLLALTSHAGLDRFSLCGVSVGGMIGQRVAARHGQRLDALVLCNTAARIGDASLWNARISAVEGGGIASISEAVLERWFSPDFRASEPARCAGYRNMLERAPVAGYLATCGAIRDADLSEEIGAIRTPTLVVAGENDRSTPPELVERTAAAIPHSRFTIIAQCGHIPSIEQPEALAGLVDDHIERASSA